jgi:hypothetical protein
MKFDALFRAFDAAMALRDAAKRFKGEAPPPADTGLATASAPGSALVGQIENRLTNVVVAALKEAFDRDHARLELERAQLEEQRRRAEDAMRAELRRQALDRELARLRLIGGAALVGWIASVALVVSRLSVMSPPARGMAAAAWLLLLGALGAAFTAQGRAAASLPDVSMSPSRVEGQPSAAGLAGVSLWLLIAGLALSAIALLF